ncbi:MAG TPA: S41 family peptidase [Pyrinomonadaceae bacterium]
MSLRKISSPLGRGLAALILLASASPLAPPRAQTGNGFGAQDRERGREMLKIVREELEKNYYDPTFRGMDVKARFKAAEERIKNAKSNGEINSVIAQVLVELNDSHTYFIPPEKLGVVDYGWRMQVIGDKCYAVDVEPGSDAEAKGLRVGDEVWSIDGYEPTRENVWKIEYSYKVLKPRPGMRVVVVEEPNGGQRQLDVMARISLNAEALIERVLNIAEDRVSGASRFYEAKDGLLVWKLPDFETDEKEIDEGVKRALGFESLVLDLRGNGGGYEKALLRLVGQVFDRDVKIGDIKRRGETRALVAKTRGGGKVFKGRLVVLVDSNSGSAAELFARVVQLEKRGVVVGDRSAGKVMRARGFGEAVTRSLPGAFHFTPFAVSITDADVVMTDGHSLEGAGVTPDELLLPTGEDLRAGRDPVLARAAALAGAKLDAETAGSLFPVIRLKADDLKEKKKNEKKGDGGKGEKP